jgi:hypothetical protein
MFHMCASEEEKNQVLLKANCFSLCTRTESLFFRPEHLSVVKNLLQNLKKYSFSLHTVCASL